MVGLLTVLLLVPRPALTGPEALLEANAAFRIHYTLSGADAPAHGAIDVAPANGIPDDIDAIFTGIVTVYDRYVTREGMRAPLSDGSLGGDGRIDVYLRKLDGPGGYTHVEEIGMAHAASAWIELDPRTALDAPLRLSAAAGHETHHAIEYAYTTTLAPFVYEATACYVEHANFQSNALQAETNAHYAALWAHPEKPIDLIDGRHEYDEMALIGFVLDKRAISLGALWDAMTLLGDAVDGLARSYPRDEDMIVHYAEWLKDPCVPAGSNLVPGRCRGDASANSIGVAALPSVVDIPLPALSMAWVSVGGGKNGFATDVMVEGADAVAWVGDGVLSDVSGTPGNAKLETAGRSLVFARGKSATSVLTLSLSEGIRLNPPDAGDPNAPKKISLGCACRIDREHSQSSANPLVAAGLLPIVLLFLRRFSRLRRGRRASE